MFHAEIRPTSVGLPNLTKFSEITEVKDLFSVRHFWPWTLILTSEKLILIFGVQMLNKISWSVHDIRTFTFRESQHSSRTKERTNQQTTNKQTVAHDGGDSRFPFNFTGEKLLRNYCIACSERMKRVHEEDQLWQLLGSTCAFTVQRFRDAIVCGCQPYLRTTALRIQIKGLRSCTYRWLICRRFKCKGITVKPTPKPEKQECMRTYGKCR